MFTMYLKGHTDFFDVSALAAIGLCAADAELLAGALIFKHIGQIVSAA